MKIDAFLEEDIKEVIRKRKMFEESVKLEADKSRRRFYGYPTHKNYLEYLKAKQNLKIVTQ